VLRRGALAFFEAPDTPPGAHRFFDLRGGGVTREIEQYGLIIRTLCKKKAPRKGGAS
jgi:hypothetical protein